MSPMFICKVAVAPEKKCSCSPAALADSTANEPSTVGGLPLVQVHESPPSAPSTAPVGSEPSNHVITGLFAEMFTVAKARRPSGHCASASIHCTPLFTGANVKVEP